MSTPVLFLESASGYAEDCSHDDALKAVKGLIATLLAIRQTNRKVALNSDVALKVCQVASNWMLGSVLHGNRFREEWDFLRLLADKSPISSGLEDWSESAGALDAFSATGSTSSALVWAYMLDTATVSFSCRPEWKSPWVKGAYLALNEAGETESFEVEIRNTSEAAHIEDHTPWLKNLGFEQAPRATVLWEERSDRFPYLRFLPRARADLDILSTSGAPYAQALKALEGLNDDAQAWAGSADWPKFSGKVSPEHENRKKLCFVVDEQTGHSESFDWHARFTGGFEGRVHFRVSQSESKFVVAYIGFKLNRPIA